MKSLKTYILENKLQDCVIVLGRFQPFTRAHLAIGLDAAKENNVPVVYLIINNKKIDDKHPFTNEITEKEFAYLKKNNTEFKMDYIFVNTANPGEFGPLLTGKGYNPILWVCGSDRIKDYTRMCKYKDNGGIPDLKVKEVHRTDDDISATKAREALKNNDLETFKRMSPIEDKKIINELKNSL